MVSVMVMKQAHKPTPVGRIGTLAITLACLTFTVCILLMTSTFWTGPQYNYEEEHRKLDELDQTVDMLNETVHELSADLLILKKELALFNASVHEFKDSVVTFRDNMTAIKDIILQLQFKFGGLVNGVENSENGLHGFEKAFEEAKARLEEISDRFQGPVIKTLVLAEFPDDHENENRFHPTSEKSPTAGLQNPTYETLIPTVFPGTNSEWDTIENDQFYDDSSDEEVEAHEEPNGHPVPVGDETDPEIFQTIILNDEVDNEELEEVINDFEKGLDGWTEVHGLQENNDRFEEDAASTGLPEAVLDALQNINDEPEEIAATVLEVPGAPPESGSDGGFKGQEKEHLPPLLRGPIVGFA